MIRMIPHIVKMMTIQMMKGIGEMIIQMRMIWKTGEKIYLYLIDMQIYFCTLNQLSQLCPIHFLMNLDLFVVTGINQYFDVCKFSVFLSLHIFVVVNLFQRNQFVCLYHNYDQLQNIIQYNVIYCHLRFFATNLIN